MGIRVACPKGPPVDAEPQLAGQRGRCPHCQTEVLVPASSVSTFPPMWYVRLAAGGELGPVDERQFQQWIAERRITGNSEVRRAGWSAWQLASEVVPQWPSPSRVPPAGPNVPAPNVATSDLAPTEDLAISEEVTIALASAVSVAQFCHQQQKRKKRRSRLAGVLLLVVVIALGSTLSWVVCRPATPLVAAMMATSPIVPPVVTS